MSAKRIIYIATGFFIYSYSTLLYADTRPLYIPPNVTPKNVPYVQLRIYDNSVVPAIGTEYVLPGLENAADAGTRIDKDNPVANVGSYFGTINPNNGKVAPPSCADWKIIGSHYLTDFDSASPGNPNTGTDIKQWGGVLGFYNPPANQHPNCNVVMYNNITPAVFTALSTETQSDGKTLVCAPLTTNTANGQIDCALQIVDNIGNQYPWHVVVQNPLLYAYDVNDLSDELVQWNDPQAQEYYVRNSNKPNLLQLTVPESAVSGGTGYIIGENDPTDFPHGLLRSYFFIDESADESASVFVTYGFDASEVCNFSYTEPTTGEMIKQGFCGGAAIGSVDGSKFPIAYIKSPGNVEYFTADTTQTCSTDAPLGSVCSASLGNMHISIVPDSNKHYFLQVQNLTPGVYQINIKATAFHPTAAVGLADHQTLYLNVTDNADGSPKNILTYPDFNAGGAQTRNWTATYLYTPDAVGDLNSPADGNGVWTNFSSFLSGGTGDTGVQNSNVKVVYNGTSGGVEYSNAYGGPNGQNMWPIFDEDGQTIKTPQDTVYPIFSQTVTTNTFGGNQVQVRPIDFQITNVNIGLTDKALPGGHPNNYWQAFANLFLVNGIATMPAIQFTNPLGGDVPTFNPQQYRYLAQYLTYVAATQKLGGITIDSEMPNLALTGNNIATFWKMLADDLAYQGKTLSMYGFPSSMIQPNNILALGPLGYFIISAYDGDNDYSRTNCTAVGDPATCTLYDAYGASFSTENQAKMLKAFEQDYVCTAQVSTSSSNANYDTRFAPSSWCNLSYNDSFYSNFLQWNGVPNGQSTKYTSASQLIQTFNGHYQVALPFAGSATENAQTQIWNPILGPVNDAEGNTVNPSFFMIRGYDITNNANNPVDGQPTSDNLLVTIQDSAGNSFRELCNSPAFQQTFTNAQGTTYVHNRLVGMLANPVIYGVAGQTPLQTQQGLCKALRLDDIDQVLCNQSNNQNMSNMTPGYDGYSNLGATTVAYEFAKACLFNANYTDGTNTYEDYLSSTDVTGNPINVPIQGISECSVPSVGTAAIVPADPAAIATGDGTAIYAAAQSLMQCMTVTGLPGYLNPNPDKVDQTLYGIILPKNLIAQGSYQTAGYGIPAGGTNQYYWWSAMGAFNNKLNGELVYDNLHGGVKVSDLAGETTAYADPNRSGFALYQIAQDDMSGSDCFWSTSTGYASAPNCRSTVPLSSATTDRLALLAPAGVPAGYGNYLNPSYDGVTLNSNLWQAYATFLRHFANQVPSQ